MSCVIADVHLQLSFVLLHTVKTSTRANGLLVASEYGFYARLSLQFSPSADSCNGKKLANPRFGFICKVKGIFYTIIVALAFASPTDTPNFFNRQRFQCFLTLFFILYDANLIVTFPFFRKPYGCFGKGSGRSHADAYRHTSPHADFFHQCFSPFSVVKSQFYREKCFIDGILLQTSRTNFVTQDAHHTIAHICIKNVIA